VCVCVCVADVDMSDVRWRYHSTHQSVRRHYCTWRHRGWSHVTMSCHCNRSSTCHCRRRSSSSCCCSWNVMPRSPSPPPLLLLLLLLMMLSFCSAQWVHKPSDTAQRLGLNVTFNCSAGLGQGSVAWLKLDDGSSTLLFINEDSWAEDATRRMRAVAMLEGGYSLTVTSLERSDDARYQCTIRDLTLSHTATLTVLGMFISLLLSLILTLCVLFVSEINY